METIIQSLLTLKWQDWATAAGIIFGVVTLLAYLDQRRTNKNQSILIEFVKRNLNKDISEETIKQLAAQREAMETQIKLHIPALARAAVLREQAEAHAQAISHHYTEWQRVIKELDGSPTEGAIDKDIEGVIVDRILPKYERQWALDSVKNRITALSMAIALSSTFLFYPLNLLVGVPLAFPLIKGLIEFQKLQGLPKDLVKNTKFGLLAFYIVGAIWAGFIGVLLFLKKPDTVGEQLVCFAFLATSAILFAFSNKFFRWIGVFLKKKIAAT